MYKYKDKVEVVPLAMVDDLIGVANCGFESVSLNCYINTQIELKKLTFHTPDDKGKSKCNFMHIGSKTGVCPQLKVHGENMNEISHDTYLGDIIMNNGSNELNILARASKGQGKVTEIVNILEKVTFGTHYFKVAQLLRESNFLNGIMTNSEVWYGVTQKQVEQMEAVDKLLLRNFLGTPISTPLEGVQLEFGVLSIGTIIKARRINFLHYLLQTQENEMLSKFFQGQLNQPVKQDWTEQVGKDLKDFKIELTHEEIKSETADKFKLFVKRKSI